MLNEPPIIGITVDTTSRSAAEVKQRGTPDARLWYESPWEYGSAVSEAGGVPILLPYQIERIDAYLDMCDGIVLSGGDDPDMRQFGEATHPSAVLINPMRQQFEMTLMDKLEGAKHPVLGVCLGMQWMALAAGGKLHQHLPEAPGFDDTKAALHKQQDHEIALQIDSHPYVSPGVVHSSHHQAVADPGDLRVVATAPDGVIEVIDRSGERFYLGVQWHPERTRSEPLGVGIYRHLVEAARRSTNL